MKKSIASTLVLTLLCGAVLSACGGGGGDTPPPVKPGGGTDSNGGGTGGGGTGGGGTGGGGTGGGTGGGDTGGGTGDGGDTGGGTGGGAGDIDVGGGSGPAGDNGENGSRTAPPAQTASALQSTRIASAGIQTHGMSLYGCDTGVPASGWTMRYVASNGSGAGAGTKASPHATVNAALTAAASNAKVVLCVAAGTYQQSIDLGTNRSVVLAGAFAPDFMTRSPSVTPTILQPAAVGNDVIYAQAPNELTIDGVEVTGSERRGINITLWGSAGKSVVLRNSHIHHNGSTSNHGSSATGGVSIGGGGLWNVTVANNVIESNDGWHHGGGINIGGAAETVNPVIRGTANGGFGNLASQAAGLAKIEYNIIRNNRVLEPTLPHGGGLAIGMNAIVDHNEFFANDTTGSGAGYGVGGAMIAQHGTSNGPHTAMIRVQNNWFEGNRATKAGSAIFFDQTNAGYVINNVIVGNEGPGALLVDGACSNSCAGTGGNNDRNFMTVVSNTIANNIGAGIAIQDSTAHLYYNVMTNNTATDDILLMGGSVGADNIVRGSHNIIGSTNSGLTNTINVKGMTNIVNAQFKLNSETVAGMQASVTNPAFIPAFTFIGSLWLSHMLPQDFQYQTKLRANGSYLYGAFANIAP